MQHYMTNLMLVPCVIASHVEVWNSVLVVILSGVDSDHGTGPRRNDLMSLLYPIERMSC